MFKDYIDLENESCDPEICEKLFLICYCNQEYEPLINRQP